MHILGVDTGGTFTDLVYFDGQSLLAHKELSTPDAPENAILNGINAMGIEIKELHIVHGTTVATNALLEGKGARTIFITNHGFKDLLLIGRQTRRELYNLTPKKQRSLFDTQLSLETGGRVNPQGETIQPLLHEEIKELETRVDQLQPQAVAICLLFSFFDARHEQTIKKILAEKYFVSISSEVLAEHREYERGLATWLNSYLGPVMQGYLSRLHQQLANSQISVMQSHGLTLSATVAKRNAVRLLLSGPAGGLWASQHAGGEIGHAQLLTFDMGGTSTDVSIINQEFNLTNQGEVAGLPIAVPMLDIHTIGAGGGSMAWVDVGGLLQVGPASAGATPGPACYGQGGKDATVTDAHVVLGRLPASSKLAGNLPLDHDAAHTAVAELAELLRLSVDTCAQGIVRVANEQMAQALRVMSVHRGHDPNNFTLVSFGGAGGLHVCDLADALNINYALVPAYAGVLSAFGLLIAPPGKEQSQSYIKLINECRDKEIDKIFYKLEKKLFYDLEDGSSFTLKREVELRYQGQASTLKLLWEGVDQAAQVFHLKHESRFGYGLKMPVELVNLRLTASGEPTRISQHLVAPTTPAHPCEQTWLQELNTEVPVYKRAEIGQKQVLLGPLIIVEPQATVYIAPRWRASLHGSGGLLLERTDIK